MPSEYCRLSAYRAYATRREVFDGNTNIFAVTCAPVTELYLVYIWAKADHKAFAVQKQQKNKTKNWTKKSCFWVTFWMIVDKAKLCVRLCPADEYRVSWNVQYVFQGKDQRRRITVQGWSKVAFRERSTYIAVTLIIVLLEP